MRKDERQKRKSEEKIKLETKRKKRQTGKKENIHKEKK